VIDSLRVYKYNVAYRIYKIFFQHQNNSLLTNRISISIMYVLIYVNNN